MNEKIDVKVETLKPFTRFIMTIGELPTSYLMSMTYYEQLIWLTKYLQDTVIPTVNNNAQAVEEVQQIVIDLQNYVNNYFDNLDVQEEIDNKLDEMVEDGTFDTIINETLFTELNNTTMKKWDEDQELNIVTGNVNMNGYNLIATTGQKFSNCEVTNGNISFDTIATETSDPEYEYYNAHATFENEVIFKNCNFTSEHVTRVDFRKNSNIIFENCKFTNIYLHFSGDENEGPQTIKIRNCKFTQTIANTTATYGSTEYIHLTNTQDTLDNCIIEGCIFDTSSQDCIDVFPNGSDILITGNTFTNCGTRIMEIKMQKQDISHVGARGVIISNNFFKNIPNDTKCIVMYNRDETGADPQDLTLYPKVIYSNNVFVNEVNNSSGIDCFYIYDNVKTQISNCRTIGFNYVTNGKFIHCKNVQINIDNCISQAQNFIFEDYASNTSKLYVSNCDAIDDLYNITLGSVRYVNELYMNNCRFRYPNITESTNMLFLTNCKLTSNLQLYKGKYFITNCNIIGVVDHSTEDERPYVCITNSMTQNNITAQDWIILDNVKRFV